MMKKFLLSHLLFALLFSSNLFCIEAKKSPFSDLELSSKESSNVYPASFFTDKDLGPFVSSNAGLGFLFESSNTPLKSAVFEAILGYNVNSFVKVGAAYQYQTPIHVQSSGHQYNYDLGISQYQSIQYNVQLQSLAMKVYLAPELPLIFKSLVVSPYLSLGAGLGYLELGRDAHKQQAKAFANRKLRSLDALMMAEGGLTLGTQLISATAGGRLCRYQSTDFMNGFFALAPYAGIQINF